MIAPGVDLLGQLLLPIFGAIYLVIGRRLQGKTTLAYFITRSAPKRIIIDPRGLIRPAGALVVFRTTDIHQAISELSDDDLPSGTVVVTPTDLESGFAAAIRDVAKWIQKRPHARLTLMIDEFRFVRSVAERSKDFEWLLRCSDPERVNIVITCHRPTDIPVDVRSIADHWLMFRMTQEHDLKVVEERSTRAAQRVQRLDARVYVHWNDAEGETRPGDPGENPSTFSQAERWYVPLRSDAGQAEPPIGNLADLEPEPAENDGKLPLSS